MRPLIPWVLTSIRINFPFGGSLSKSPGTNGKDYHLLINMKRSQSARRTDARSKSSKVTYQVSFIPGNDASLFPARSAQLMY